MTSVTDLYPGAHCGTPSSNRRRAIGHTVERIRLAALSILGGVAARARYH